MTHTQPLASEVAVDNHHALEASLPLDVGGEAVIDDSSLYEPLEGLGLDKLLLINQVNQVTPLYSLS